MLVNSRNKAKKEGQSYFDFTKQSRMQLQKTYYTYVANGDSTRVLSWYLGES